METNGFTGGVKMPGFGSLFIIIGLYILLNTFGKMKRNKDRLAVRPERTTRNRHANPDGFRPARKK
jgi:hypothetical protein